MRLIKGQTYMKLQRLHMLVVAAGLLANLAAGAAELSVRVTDAGGQPLADAAVFLESPAAKAAAKPKAGVEIEQVNRTFLPRVTVVPAGSAISFPNHDTVRHHVYSFSNPKTFDLKLYAGTPTAPVLFDKPGVIVLGCNIHDQMIAWIVAVETPYYGKTDNTGSLVLNNVPPGSYHLRVWHSRMPQNAAIYDLVHTVGASAPPTQVVLKGLDP
jgi:plastocyanin